MKSGVRVNASLDRNVWRLRWTFNHKRYSLNTGIRANDQQGTKRLKETIRLIERDLKLGILRERSYYKALVNPKNKPLALADIFRRFTVSRKDLQPSTRKVVYGMVQRILDKSKLTLEDANQLPKWLANQGYSSHTIRKVLNRCNASLEWALEQNLIVSNPLAGLKPPKTRRTKQPDPFSQSEIKAILQAFHGTNDYYLVMFLLLTGCRPSEALALTWDNVNFNEQFIEFDQAIVAGELKRGLKTQARRKFPISDQLRELLAQMPKNGGLLFPVKWASFRNAWKNALQSAGVRYRSPYTLRATFISEMIKKGLNPAIVAKIAGNSPSIIYQHYLEVGENFPDLPGILPFT
jgi:integrase